MRQRLVTVDRFYDAPYDIRRQALAAEYKDNLSIQSYVTEEAVGKLSYLAQQPVEPILDFPTGKFQTHTLDHKWSVSANPIADWIAIVYLALPSQIEGNQCLSLYTHVVTQTENIPNQLQQHLQGWTTEEEMYEGFILQDGQRSEAWSPWFTGFGRYNRCIMFDAKLWHAQLTGFGDTINNCRLSQLFFLRNR